MKQARNMQVREDYAVLFLAKRMWTEDEFAKTTFPDCRNFSAGYIEWLFAQGEIPDDIGVAYPALLSEVSAVLDLPVIETKLKQNGKTTDIDHVAMLKDMLLAMKENRGC